MNNEIRWYRVREPNQIGFMGSGLLAVLGFLFMYFNFFNIIFLVAGLIGVYVFYPTSIKRQVIKFMRLIGIVDERDTYNGYSYYKHWPKVYYARYNGYLYLKLVEVSISQNVSLDRIVQEIFGLQLIEKQSKFGSYVLKLGIAPRKEMYNWHESRNG